MNTSITIQDFTKYRKDLGFTNQSDVRNFLAAKDVIPTVDFNYIDQLNTRLAQIIKKINSLVSKDINIDKIDEFCTKNIQCVFQKLKDNQIIEKLTNQGRRPEQVYFSWMRGNVISNYFLRALEKIFEVDFDNIQLIGDDNLTNIELFKRTPKADLEILLKDGTKLRIEMQSGFQGTNDIKQHKVLEAKKIAQTEKIASFAIHFDLFNGQVAFVRLDTIEDDSINWITRQQMEGQTVFNIEQNYSIWKLTDNPPKFNDIFTKQ